MKFPEDFLHFVWKYRLFDHQDLITVTGECVQILHPGQANKDAGPDFHMAKIEINGVEWIGNVEIHVDGHHWNTHGHQRDAAYDNVILHVVYRHDVLVKRSDNTSPYTLELEGRIYQHVLRHYQDIMENEHWIACERLIGHVDLIHIQKWSDTLLVERLLQKSGQVFDLLAESKGDWEATAFRFLARSFGFKTNAPAFERLAQSIPVSLLGKLKGDALRIEALIFGQAGFLEDLTFQDAYPESLKTEYNYLKRAYGLKPLQKSMWKFSRMRPHNFPTIRLAQFAAYCNKNRHFFRHAIDATDLSDTRQLFQDLPIHPYWQTHFRFDKVTKPNARQLGVASIENLIVNFIVILLFSYGHHIKNEQLMQQALKFLEQLPPEDNHVIRGYEALGLFSRNAGDSQSRLQLKAIYCDKKRCLECGVGLQIIKYKKE